MGWQSRFFRDCAELIRDTVQPDEMPGLPYIGLEHISQGQLSLLGYGKSEDVVSPKSKFREGDILFGKLRPYFRKVILAPFDGVCSTDIWVVRAKTDIDQKYLFYWMASEDFIEAVSRASEGTKMPRAQWEFATRIQQKVPPLPEQRAIAAVLGALDDKIELNRRMNRALEAIAQAVFREIMKDVEEEGSILEFADLLSGGTPSTAEESYWNGNIEWVSAKDVSNAGGVFLLDTEKKITQAGIDHSSTKLLPAKTTIVTARGTVGAYSMLGKSMTMNQTNYGLKAKEGIGDYFVYFALSEMVEQLKQQSYGTIFDTITTKTFYSVLCPRPSLGVIQKFEKQVAPLMDTILNNQRQSRILAALRDAILPKLMRGEVRVKVVERF
jgi:type I restriction enzyme S subunit